MPFNRIAGFYFGSNSWQKEIKSMTLEEKNAELNQLFDNRIEQLNAVFEKAETEFKGMRLIGESEYAYRKWQDEDTQAHYYKCAFIGLVKLQGQWRLCHSYGDELEGARDAWKPIRDASVFERVEAVKHLTKLQEAIVAQKERLIPSIEAAIARGVSAIEDFQNRNRE